MEKNNLIQEQQLADVIRSLQINPKLNNGWHFDYKFIERIAHKTEELDTDEYVSMEQVDILLLVLCNMT